MRTTNADRNAAPVARTGREAWIGGALALLIESGIDAVRVEPLALRLGVTKGSFYWHFKDRAELHAAMIEQWRGAGLHDIMARVEESGGTPRDKLHRLMSITALNPKAARLETAMRGWARHDTDAAKAVALTDRERLNYVSTLLEGLGVKPVTAALRARIIYLMVIGGCFATGPVKIAGREVWREIEALIAP